MMNPGIARNGWARRWRTMRWRPRNFQSHLRDSGIPPANRRGWPGGSAADEMAAFRTSYAKTAVWHRHCETKLNRK